MAEPWLRKEVIGNCTLYLGDCLDVLIKARGSTLNCAAITDPPYGISHSSNFGASWEGTKIKGDNDTSTRDQGLHHFANVAAFGTWKTPAIHQAKAALVWDKGPAFGMGDLSFPWKPSWELIYIRGDIWGGFRDQGVLRGHMQVSWENHPNVPQDERRRHPHQKPVSLVCALLEKLPSDTLVFDPFMGSGTTGVACVKLGRKFVGIEIEPKYFDIACQRIEAAYAQPDIFIEAEKKAEQLSILDEAAA